MSGAVLDVQRSLREGVTLDVLEVWVVRILIGFLSGIAVKVAMFLARRAYRILKEVIRQAKKHQRQDAVDLWNGYADMEELIGDFLEKYRGFIRQTPSPSRVSVFCRVMLDLAGLMWALTLMALRRLLASNETPRA